MDSILTSVKKMLGIQEEYDHFDHDLIFHINSTFSILTQLGVGPSVGFSIFDESSTWSDFISDAQNLELIKTYMYLKVRLIFDPPSTASVIDAYERSIKEMEWRIQVIIDQL